MAEHPEVFISATACDLARILDLDTEEASVDVTTFSESMDMKRREDPG
jgi:hypothetical protein